MSLEAAIAAAAVNQNQLSPRVTRHIRTRLKAGCFGYLRLICPRKAEALLRPT